MTDTAPETDVDDTTAPQGDEGPVIGKLRKELAEARKATAELEALRRERAFDKAGIPEEGAGKWFRKGYEGDLDPAAIKAAAAEDGLIDVTSTEDTEQARTAAAAATAADRIAEAATEGGSPQPTVDTLLADPNITNDDIERLMQDAELGVRPS